MQINGRIEVKELCQLYSNLTKVFLFRCLEVTEQSVWTLPNTYEHLNFFALCGLKDWKFKLDFNPIWHKEQDGKIISSFHRMVFRSSYCHNFVLEIGIQRQSSTTLAPRARRAGRWRPSLASEDGFSSQDWQVCSLCLLGLSVSPAKGRG